MEGTISPADFDRITSHLAATSPRIEHLKQLRQTRLLEGALAGLPREMQRTRLDCLIWLYVIQFPGWRRRKRGPNGEVLSARVEEAPVYHERRLGCPREKRVLMGVRRVNKACPTETKEYKAAFYRFKEARRRWLATKTNKSWRWYSAGKGNRQSIVYRYCMAEIYGFHRQDRFMRGWFKYLPWQLLPRAQERKRARREMKEELKVMGEWREAIFDKMKVPEVFRTLI